MSKGSVAQLAPAADAPPATPDAEMIRESANRIEAIAQVLDDIQRCHIFVRRREQTFKRDVVRDGLVLLLFEEVASLHREAGR